MMSAMARLIRFGLSGAITTSLAYLVFTGAIASGVSYLPAGFAAWAVGVGVSYGLNRRFTFQIERPLTGREFLLFVSGYVLQLVLGLADYAILIGRLRLDPSAAFTSNLVVSASVSFLFMQLAVFRERRPTTGLQNIALDPLDLAS